MKLKPGTKIYRCYNGHPTQQLEIDKVNEKTAFAGNLRFEIEYDDEVKLFRGSHESMVTYVPVNDQTTADFEKHKLAHKLSRTDWDKLSIEKLEQINNIVNESN